MSCNTGRGQKRSVVKAAFGPICCGSLDSGPTMVPAVLCNRKPRAAKVVEPLLVQPRLYSARVKLQAAQERTGGSASTYEAATWTGRLAQLQEVSISRRTVTVGWFSGTWITRVFSTMVELFTVFLSMRGRSNLLAGLLRQVVASAAIWQLELRHPPDSGPLKPSMDRR